MRLLRRGSIVNFKSFVTDQQFLGDLAGSVYPTWVDRILRFLGSGSRILVLYGSYAIGKSFIMKIILLWNLYIITKIPNIRGFFGKSPSTVISLMLYSPSIGSVGSEDLHELASMIDGSPYFSKVCPIIRKNARFIALKGNIRIYIGKDRGDARSKQLFFAGLDEGNFLSENGKISYTRASGIYREVITRIKGRWSLPKGYGIPYLGMVVVSSSADSSDSFVETVMKDGLKSGDVHVERMAKYDISEEYFGGERFDVFEGEGEVPPHIMSYPSKGCTRVEFYRNSSIEAIILNLYGLSYEDFVKTRSLKIHRPPVDLLSFYETDIRDALQSLSGVAVDDSKRLFKSMTSVYGSIESEEKLADPLLFESVPLLVGDSTEFEDCIDLSILARNYTGGQVFFHIDQSKSKDSTGVAFVEKKEYDYFRVILAFTVVPSKENHVDLMRVAQLPLFLRDTMGWDISFGTYDSYESAVPMQTLDRLMGDLYLPNGKKMRRIGKNSVESADPYLTLVNLFRRNKIRLYENELLFKELSNLQLDRQARKVDHPENFDSGERGSKDLADAVCGAVMGAINVLGLDDLDLTISTSNDVIKKLDIERKESLDDTLDIIQRGRFSTGSSYEKNKIIGKIGGIYGGARF